MAEVPLPLPLGGLSDAQAFSRQSPNTTRDARNMRGQDPTNGRIRPAQRAGMSKANTAQVKTGQKVAELASVVYDSRNVTYDFTSGSEAVKWAKTTPSKSECLMGVTDDKGNVYALDGNAGIVKLNPDGAVVWQFALPVKDQEDTVRWLHVDDLLDVYAGVSTGRDVRDARIWKLTQLPDAEVEIAWEFATGAHVENGLVRRDRLYTIQNDATSRASWVRVYEQLDGLEPALAQEWKAAYPTNDLAVKADGSVLVASEYAGDDGTGPGAALSFQRNPNPRFPELAPEAEDWTPWDLDEAERRIWSWYIADEIDEFDVAGDLRTNASINVWRDVSGNERHLYPNLDDTVSPDTAPVYIPRGLGSHAGVRFDGTAGMVSLANTSKQLAYADGQRSSLPAYEGSMYCTFIVCRIEQAADVYAVFSGGVQGNGSVLRANSSAYTNVATAYPASQGDIAFHMNAGDGAGTGGAPLESTFVNANDTVLITILQDNGINPSNPGAAFTRSVFRVNGLPIDRWESPIASSSVSIGVVPSTLGRNLQGAASGFEQRLKGEVFEWITLDRRDRKDTTFSDPDNLVLTHSAGGSDPGGDDDASNVEQADDEMTRIEGYLMHKYGLQHLAPAAGTYDHPYGATGTENTLAGPPTGADAGAAGATQAAYALLVKYSSQGKPIWAINEDVAEAGGAVSGVGYAVEVNSDGNVYSMGPAATNRLPSTTNYLRMLVDNGSTVSTTGDAWGANIGAPGYKYPRLAVDKHDNVYAPVFDATNPLRVYKKDGTLLSDVTLGASQKAHAIAIDPRIPDYEGDLTDPLAEFVYVFTDEPVADDPVVHRVRLVTVSAQTGSPRTIQHVAIAGDGTVGTFDLGGASVGTPTNSTGETVLSASARYFHTATMGGEIVISDGLSDLRVYDPRDNEITTLESTTAGSPPHRAKILEVWRDRLVACRAVGLISEAFAWTMSRIGDKRDWDTVPPDGDPSAAISGSNARGPGNAPDIVNGFIPYNDDLAFVLGDSSIWMLTGDPGDGGQFDLVSDEWGGAFGRAWAKDPEGNVYFFGSRGGLFRMPPGGLPERVTRNNIEQRLRAVDLESNYIRMAWNEDDEGLHIMQFPYGAPAGAQLKHWFWDTRVMAAWEDVFGTSASQDVQPTAMRYVDGDASDDRVLLLGCEDGYVRKWDPDAYDDDGTAIDAYVLLGPLAGSQEMRELRFRGPRVVLDSRQSGARYELFSTDQPDTPGVARASGPLVAGRNLWPGSRVRGSYCFVKLANAIAGQRFAVEEAAMQVHQGGRKRLRGA